MVQRLQDFDKMAGHEAGTMNDGTPEGSTAP